MIECIIISIFRIILLEDYKELCALIVSILSFILSIVATVISSVIANKPYYKKLCLSETFVDKKDEFGISISNVGRVVVFIERIELVELKTNKCLGQLFLNNGNDKFLFSIEPGEVKYITLNLFENNPYCHVADPNKYLKVVIYEKNGNIEVFKNIFAVG